MSSIRLFILSSFAELGPTHGHRVRIEAEKRRVHLWTDISTGAVYGAINRLASEGLLREYRKEIEGNRPPRQLYEITEAGRSTLEVLQQETAESIWFRFDPFDLAMTCVDRGQLQEFSKTVIARIAKLKTMISEREAVIEDALKCIDSVDEWALRHSSYRLDAEVRYFRELLAWLELQRGQPSKKRPRTAQV
jgi:DNA-binding PadR family transcriptional regulator